MGLTFLVFLIVTLSTCVFYLALRAVTDSRKEALAWFVPTVFIGLTIFFYFPVNSSALEMEDNYETSDITSSVVDDTVSHDDSFSGASEVVPQESGERDDSFNSIDDTDTVFRPDSDAVLDNLGDEYAPEPFPFSGGTNDVDSGFSAATVGEDVHALREYSEFFLFGFVPITIAVIVLALGCNWFYRTFVSSTFF